MILTTPFYGQVTPPDFLNKFSTGSQGQGLIVFLNIILSLVFISAGIYAFWQIIASGWKFMTSGGNPEALQEARDKIIWSLLGLVIIISSFVLAAIIGILFFGDASAILQPKLKGVSP